MNEMGYVHKGMQYWTVNIYLAKMNPSGDASSFVDHPKFPYESKWELNVGALIVFSSELS